MGERRAMISKHFTDDEFRCPCCGTLPIGGINQALINALDQLREIWGQPIIIASGYRCPSHNSSVGGAIHSQHILGRAADLADHDGSLESFISEEMLGQLCVSREEQDKTPGWVHLDVFKRGGSWSTFKA